MTEEKKMTVWEALKMERDRWRDVKGKAGQKARWQLNRNERKLTGFMVRDGKATKKGDSKGAFGTRRTTIDPRPALKPAEMREKYGRKT